MNKVSLNVSFTYESLTHLETLIVQIVYENLSLSSPLPLFAALVIVMLVSAHVSSQWERKIMSILFAQKLRSDSLVSMLFMLGRHY